VDITGLQGERIRLVPVDKELHLGDFVRWLNDPEVTRYVSHVLPISRLQEEKWFERLSESKEDIVWAILDETGRHIGVTGIHRINWKERDGLTGTLIGEKEAWGKGYGTDVMQTRTRYAFEQLGLHRLESECFLDNVASARCLEKVGYKRVGIAHKKRWRDGRWHDCILWELLDEDILAAARRRATGDDTTGLRQNACATRQSRDRVAGIPLRSGLLTRRAAVDLWLEPPDWKRLLPEAVLPARLNRPYG